MIAIKLLLPASSRLGCGCCSRCRSWRVPTPGRPSGPAQFVAAHEAQAAAARDRRRAWPGGTPTSPARTRTSRRRKRPRTSIDEALADPGAFAELKAHQGRTQARSTTRSLARAIDVLYLQYLEKQVDPALLKKITAKANAIEKAFNVFRAKVDGKEMTDSEVRKVLKKSTDSDRAARPSGRRARASAPSSRPT